jgi:hypothetical protein
MPHRTMIAAFSVKPLKRKTRKKMPHGYFLGTSFTPNELKEELVNEINI